MPVRIKQRSKGKSAQQYKRERMVAEADIGPPRPPEDPARVEKYRNDLLGFGYEYFPAWVSRQPSEIITNYVHRLQQSMTTRTGLRTSIAIPRGYGKTTWVKIAIIWATLYGHCRYSVIFAASDTLAHAIISDAKDQIEGNELLARDWDAACKPFRELRGSMQRAPSQTMAGVRTKISLNRSRMVFPTSPTAAFSSSTITARGITSGFLGLVKDGMRPDFALLDDVQSMKRAESDAEVDRMERAIQGGVLALGSHDRPISVVMACTVVRDGDLSDRYLDQDLHPEFSPIRHGLVVQWPDAEDLWEKYRELWAADQRSEGTEAAEYYDRHRKRMDAGAILSDPELYNPETERSAIQHAYHALFTMGAKAFHSQMQNAPQAEEVSYKMVIKDVAAAVNGMAHRDAPKDTSALIAFSDINHDGVRYAVLAFSKMGRFAIIDYGKHPSRGALVKPNSTESETQHRIFNGLDAIGRHLAETVYTRDGQRMQIRAWGIDKGYKAEVAHAYAKHAQLPFAVLPSKGFSASWYNPKTKGLVGVPGYMCHVSETEYGQFLATNADHWREVTQRAFLALPGAPGSCSFWGTDKTAHWDIAEHVCAEVLVDKGTGNRGTPFYRWMLKPGSKNDYLDCIVGAIATGAWFRCFDPIAADEKTKHAHAVAGAAKRRPRTQEKRRCKVSVV